MAAMNFISMQIKCWIKQRFCRKLWLFSSHYAIKTSPSSSRIACMHSCNPYTTVWESDHSGRTNLQSDTNFSDLKLSKMHHPINPDKSNITVIKQEMMKNSFIDEQISVQNGIQIAESTGRFCEVTRHVKDIRNPPFPNYKGAFSSDSDDFDRTRPQRILNIYTDASGRYGLGCVWDKKWIVSQWEDEWLSNNFRCMELLEMKAILVSILTWGSDWNGCIVRIHCDNKMVVEYFNHRMRLQRKVFNVYRCIKLAALKFNFKLVVEQANKSHITFQGSDSLSRLDFRRFYNLLPYMNHRPDLPPENLEFLLPNIWENICVSVKLRNQSYGSGHR